VSVVGLSSWKRRYNKVERVGTISGCLSASVLLSRSACCDFGNRPTISISRKLWTDGGATISPRVVQSAQAANDMSSELAPHMPDNSQLSLKHKQK
jgi:hypothetical protein